MIDEPSFLVSCPELPWVELKQDLCREGLFTVTYLQSDVHVKCIMLYVHTITDPSVISILAFFCQWMVSPDEGLFAALATPSVWLLSTNSKLFFKTYSEVKIDPGGGVDPDKLACTGRRDYIWTDSPSSLWMHQWHYDYTMWNNRTSSEQSLYIHGT